MHIATIPVDREKTEMMAGQPISVNSMLTLAHKNRVDLHVSLVPGEYYSLYHNIDYYYGNYGCII